MAACGSGGESDSTGDILIGAPLPLTGYAAGFGVPMANAAEMTVEAINRAGGIKELDGRKLRLLVKDTQSDPATSGKLIREMARDGVSALVGPIPSGEVIANLPLLKSLGIATFATGGDDKITENNQNGVIFRVGNKTSAAAEQALEFLKQLEADGKVGEVKRVGVLTASVPPGPSVAAAFEKGAGEMGATVTAIQYDATQVKDFAPIVAKMKSADVDVILGFQYINDATLLAKAISQQTWRPPAGIFQSGSSTALDTFRKTAGSGAVGMTSSIGCPLTDTDYYPAEARSLAKTFQEKYGTTLATSYACSLGGSISLVADALAEAGSSDKSMVLEAARKLTFSDPKASRYPYYTLGGGVKFDKDQNNAEVMMPFIQLGEDGKFKTVFPVEVADGEWQPSGVQ